MRPRTSVAAVLLFGGLLAIRADASDVLELRDFVLIDGTGAAPRPVERLLIHDGRIAQIDDSGTAPPAAASERWTRIALDGAFVMPGLIDTHVHVARFPDTRARAVQILERAVRGGITGVRDLGGDARALADIERAIGSRELVAPLVVHSALLGGPDIFRQGPTAAMSAGRVPGQAPWAHVVDAGTDLPRLIAAARGSGAGNIKIYGDVEPELASALIHEATRQQLLSSAHSTVFPTRPSELVNAGIGSLSHAAYLVWEAVDQVPSDYGQRIAGPWKTVPADHPRLLALYRLMAERGVILDATLYVYEAMGSYPGVPKMDWTADAAAWGAEATRHARQAGVRVSTGTDWFEPRDERELPHTHEELALLVERAGFSPLQALVAGTLHGAIALGRDATHGTVAVGKVADLLILDADPLQDIRNTQRIRYTLRAGVVVEP